MKWPVTKLKLQSLNRPKVGKLRSKRSVDCAKLGDVCTYGILYSDSRLLDRAMDWAAYNKPKLQKINEITKLCWLWVTNFGPFGR